MNLVQTHGLTCLLGRDPLFEELDFAIEPGEVVLLKGRNGSGKSTFLRALVGLQEVNDGIVEIEGWQMNRLSPAQRELRAPLVDQAPLLNWDVTAIDNLVDNLSVGSSLLNWFLTPRRKVRREILDEYGDVIEELGLSQVMHRPARELSIGQRRLLTLVRALRRRPDRKPRVLLLDEPLAGLQHERLETVLGVLRERVADGWAIIVAEHVPEIERLATRSLPFPFRKQTDNEHSDTITDDRLPLSIREPLATTPPPDKRNKRCGCLLKLSGVSAGYYEWEIVANVSLEVREREITAIVGPNAAGKSTLFRGLFNDESTKAWLSGQIFWSGHQVGHVRDGRHIPPDAVAWIPQERFDFPGMTVEETLGGALITPEFRGFKAAMVDIVGGLRHSEREKCEDVLNLVERLREERPDGKTILESRWETLSGGERAMATVAIGLINSPTVVFLDEPAANLDTHALDDLQRILRKYIEENNAGCLLIEHRESFLDGFADHRVAVHSV